MSELNGPPFVDHERIEVIREAMKDLPPGETTAATTASLRVEPTYARDVLLKFLRAIQGAAEGLSEDQRDEAATTALVAELESMTDLQLAEARSNMALLVTLAEGAYPIGLAIHTQMQSRGIATIPLGHAGTMEEAKAVLTEIQSGLGPELGKNVDHGNPEGRIRLTDPEDSERETS
jgi:hypothetical protein